MPNVTAKMRAIMANCPDGYTVAAGSVIDMLGVKEIWRIYEHRAEAFLTRVPQDLVDTPFGPCSARVPEDWGKCIFYKLVC